MLSDISNRVSLRTGAPPESTIVSDSLVPTSKRFSGFPLPAPLRTGNWHDDRTGFLSDSWDNFLASFIEAKCNTKETVRKYKARAEWFKCFCEVEDPRQLRKAHFDAFQKMLRDYKTKEGSYYSKSTVREILVKIKSLGSWWKDYYEMKFNPADVVKLPKAEKVSKAYLAEDVIAYMVEESTGKVKLACAVLEVFGLRNGEVCRLQYKHFSIKDGEFRIDGIDGKAGLGDVSMPLREARPILLDVCDHEEQTDFLFPGLNGHITTRTLRNWISKLGVRLGIRNSHGNNRVYPHMFRTSLATNLLSRNPENIGGVAKRLRNKVSTTQDNYIVETCEELRTYASLNERYKHK